MTNRLDEISVRARQVIGALCLKRFCESFGISDNSIDQLLDHLYRFAAIAGVEEFAAWENEKREQELNGLGDPIPAHLLEALPAQQRRDFELLVAYVVEVGYCDWYGKPSVCSRDFLLKAFDLLKLHHIAIPDVGPFMVSRFDEAEGWGHPVKEELLTSWLKSGAQF